MARKAMSPSARRQLDGACAALGVAATGWECYAVSMGDDRVSRFRYDNGNRDQLLIEVGPHGTRVMLNGAERWIA